MADRLFSVVRRRPNMVDIIVPKIQGVEGYRFLSSLNFDGTFNTLFTAPIASGYLDQNINPAVLSSVPGSSLVRCVFDPATFSGVPWNLVDTQPFWLKFQPVPGTAGAPSLLLPDSAHHGTGRVTISGTAPDESSVADSLEIHLPMSMKDVIILNEEPGAGNGLYVAFETGGPEVLLPQGSPKYDPREGNISKLLVRGSGGTAAFSASFTNVFPA